MSGRNYGGANATITSVINIEINCEICMQFVFDHIKQAKGVESVIRGKKQLTIVSKRDPLEIRKNVNFSKPQKIDAVMGLNVDCDGCETRMKKIIQSTPGYQDMSYNKDDRLVTVKGTIDINTLADKLEKKLRKYVKIITVKIEGRDIGSYSCLEMKTEPLKTIVETVL